MIISHSKKFIFIHNYKVAGSSVTEALAKYSDRSYSQARVWSKLRYSTGIYPKIYCGQFNHHIKGPELKKLIPENVFKEYYKFGFVRNPWDWQVSLYNFAIKWKPHHQHEFIKNMKSFDDYIEWRVNNEVRLQKEFFYDENNSGLMDFIGKIENLQADFKTICNHIGVNENLPHVNISNPGKKFTEYYTPKTIDLIAEAFKEDIELFGYTKPVVS